MLGALTSSITEPQIGMSVNHMLVEAGYELMTITGCPASISLAASDKFVPFRSAALHIFDVRILVQLSPKTPD